MNSVGEGVHLPRRDNIRGAQVLPESLRDAGVRDDVYATQMGGSPNFVHSPTLGQSPGRDFRIDERWLIDPKLLFVGPRIGEGSHGKVYEGKYHDQSVALKLVQTSGTPEEVAKRESRFAREVSLLTRVQHKNLVKFIGACREPSLMVVVTELLQGGSLRKYLMRLRPKQLDRRLAIKFALDISEAMDCLHSHSIIHRDLKPDNLLLTADQKTVKLVDFGLAREEALTEMMTAETGTYRWMAPELYSTVTLRNGEKKHYNHKVDVYSFSIVLWELLTNRMPFEGMSNLQAAYAAAFKGTRPNLSKEVNLPEELIFLLQSCWAEDPNARPNFAQVVCMLNSYLSTLPSPDLSAPEMQIVSRSMPVPREISSIKYSKEKVQSASGDDTNMATMNSKGAFFECFGHCT
ncbi:hypothetical protein KP509_03G087700 [Ceratopteris richardii]|uniref:Protein kinase domain-containing protein n=1 Tax=Ceratopteris richardii TaxID=49495 RepID=A0A8T2V5U4_CERRI|nr:hypothetical protein KP509_03G087700 [Ceratopteris richardii]